MPNFALTDFRSSFLHGFLKKHTGSQVRYHATFSARVADSFSLNTGTDPGYGRRSRFLMNKISTILQLQKIYSLG